MPVTIIKETIELPSVTCDADGNAFLTKRINLQSGFRHMLQQVDMFQDRFPTFVGEGSQLAEFEVVVTAYPSIPTNMPFVPGSTLSYPAGGDDSILFKAHRQVYDFSVVQSFQVGQYEQFPSVQIAAMNKSYFYTDHVYINMCWKGDANRTYENLAYSFMFVLDNKKVPNLEDTLGKMAESHEAMCALVMSNGRMTSVSNLRGNTFPTWRFGGIRPENTISPTAANSFFLEIDTRDAEEMVTTAAVRQSIADSRAMSPFNEAFGDRRPDWLDMNLNQGIVAGAVRADPIPLKYADNGNTRMF